MSIRAWKFIALAIALVIPGARPDSPAPGRTAEYDYEPPTPGTYTLPAIKRAADGHIIDSTGRPLQLRELASGRITVLSFIYTRCASAKACPYATGVLNQLHRATENDSDLAANLRLASLSFDPEVDTPERMKAYSAWAGQRQHCAEWKFLTTRSHRELQPILEAFGQVVDKRANPNDPLGPFSHTLRVYLIDAQGMIRNIYSSGTLDPRLVLADIRTLLLEQHGSTVANVN